MFDGSRTLPDRTLTIVSARFFVGDDPHMSDFEGHVFLEKIHGGPRDGYARLCFRCADDNRVWAFSPLRSNQSCFISPDDLVSLVLNEENVAATWNEIAGVNRVILRVFPRGGANGVPEWREIAIQRMVTRLARPAE